MKFIKGRGIHRMALPITRHCNRNCPECMAKKRPDTVGGDHIPLQELVWVGKTMGPIQKIEMTGGEPSLHPRFPEISEHIHEWFKCDDIMVLTNGYLFDDDDALPLLLHYDRVYVTHYTPSFTMRYGTPGNTDLVNKIKLYLRDHPKVQFWEQRMDSHVPIGKPPYTGSCKFGYDRSDSLAYDRGQLYGCCTAWQLPYRGKGILLTADWRDHVNEIELPCDLCFISGEVKK